VARLGTAGRGWQASQGMVWKLGLGGAGRAGMIERRKYGHCAKCGAAKDFNSHYVGECCARGRRGGLYRFCAVGGEPLRVDNQVVDSELYEGRVYVCYDHLADGYWTH
jgi:hypothetical protein